MVKKNFLFVTLYLFASFCLVQKATCAKQNFDFGWKFILNSDNLQNATLGFDDTQWQEVQLPHDWSISLQPNSRYSGSNAHLPGGIGWYRKTFNVPSSDRGKLISILFDGIYNRSDVFINGQHLGFRPYGFCGIEYDLTPYLKFGGNNVIAVRVNNPSDNDSIARWYTGSGIYRHAWIQKRNPVHVVTYGTYITTPNVNKKRADIKIVTTIANESGKDQRITLSQYILDKESRQVAKCSSVKLTLHAGDSIDFIQKMAIQNPKLWMPADPNLYTMKTKVLTGRGKVDTYISSFGVRTISFTPDKGFFLNGEHVKLKGVCLHQDDGCLGTALPDRSMERRLEILKAYGCNAMRCSHNQPAPEFLDMCDRMGFLVIDEAFDKWKSGYYAPYFDKWWRRDMNNMILRDRNHPSVMLWSIGNELQEAWDNSDNGVNRATMLRDYVHKLEPTRPTCLAAQYCHNEKFSGVTDVVGYNYLEARMINDHKKFPGRRFLITEELPYYSGEEGNIRSYTPINPWNIISTNDFIAGGFIWVGVDYFGEAGWPSHGWPCGLFDICMNEKPRAAYHRAMWNNKPLVSIVVMDPSLDIDHGRDLWQWPNMASTWNFSARYDGLVMEVKTITNCERVELILNGTSMGIHRTADYPNNTISWYVPYTSGKISAIGYNGKDSVASFEIKTSGKPDHLLLSADREQIKADGEDLSYISIKEVDSDGVLVQNDDRKITVTLEGEGKLMGAISGDLRRTNPFTDNTVKSYFGKAMAVVQSKRKPGKMRLKVEMEGIIEPAYINIDVK